MSQPSKQSALPIETLSAVGPHRISADGAIEIGPTGLVYSGDHQLSVVPFGSAPGGDGEQESRAQK